MKEYFFEGRIYYRTNEFKPDRLTLIFVHGVSGSSSAWFPYEKIFENKYNILTFDIRGHGKSKKLPHYSDYEIKHFANDLHDLILHLNISKFVLVSHSFGTLIALEYIKLYRENVMANILLSPITDLGKGPMARIVRLALRSSKIFSLFTLNLKPGGHVDYSKHQNSTDWDIKRNLADMRNTGLRVHFYTLRQSLIPEQEYFLEKINVPTLIMHGEKDSMVPIKNSITMSKKIKNSEFISIPNVDHNTVHNCVKEISKAIESFIEKNKLL